MSKICVLLANGFEEIEAVTILDVLRRAGEDAQMVGVDSQDVLGSHNIRLHTDLGIQAAKDQRWDLIVLPGGMPGAATLRDHPDVQMLLKQQHQQGGRLAAICAAPMALAKAGLLQGKRATCFPGFEDKLMGAKFEERDVVEDGLITTSRGPATAIAFALSLVEQLQGATSVAKLRRQLLVP